MTGAEDSDESLMMVEGDDGLLGMARNDARGEGHEGERDGRDGPWERRRLRRRPGGSGDGVRGAGERR